MKPKQLAILWALCLPAALFAVAESDSLAALIAIKVASAALFYTAYRLAARWERKGKLKLTED